jgi:hypothetical protein
MYRLDVSKKGWEGEEKKNMLGIAKPSNLVATQIL